MCCANKYIFLWRRRRWVTGTLEHNTLDQIAFLGKQSVGNKIWGPQGNNVGYKFSPHQQTEVVCRRASRIRTWIHTQHTHNLYDVRCCTNYETTRKFKFNFNFNNFVVFVLASTVGSTLHGFVRNAYVLNENVYKLLQYLFGIFRIGSFIITQSHFECARVFEAYNPFRPTSKSNLLQWKSVDVLKEISVRRSNLSNLNVHFMRSKLLVIFDNNKKSLLFLMFILVVPWASKCKMRHRHGNWLYPS